MTLSEFKEQSQRTMTSLGSNILDSVHMTLGMASEYKELIEGIRASDIPNIKEEIGDMLWYVANYCTLYGIGLNYIPSTISFESPTSTLLNNILRLCDIDKKELAYGKIAIPGQRELTISHVWSGIKDIAEGMGLDMGQILQVNTDKLKVRYPEKFNKEKAIHRDTDKERKTLGN